MPWFKVDDSFHGHPKVIDLSLAAVGLWTMAGTWCAHYLTNGKITEKSVFRLGGTKSQATELVDAGLWVELDDGFEFKDWAEYQPTRESVLAERKASADRVAAYRERKKQERNGERNGVTNAERNGERTGDVRPPRPDPTRPDPTVVTKVTTEEKTTSAPDGSDAAYSDEVKALCNELADWVETNTGKRPTVGSTWLKACELMIRVDHYTPQQIHTAIEWSQRNEFWRANILSMKKLREKYQTLRLDAQRKPGTRRPDGSEVISQGKSIVEQLWLQEQEDGGKSLEA